MRPRKKLQNPFFFHSYERQNISVLQYKCVVLASIRPEMHSCNDSVEMETQTKSMFP